MLNHFSRNNPESPLHYAHAHQGWLPPDFIHFWGILQEAFLLAASNLFWMLLAKCQTSNWWLIFGSSSLLKFHICICRLVVIYSGIIPWSFKKANPFLNPIFSIRFEFPASVTCDKENAAVLLLQYFYQLKNMWHTSHYDPGCRIYHLNLDELRYFLYLL